MRNDGCATAAERYDHNPHPAQSFPPPLQQISLPPLNHLNPTSLDSSVLFTSCVALSVDTAGVRIALSSSHPKLAQSWEGD